MYCTFIRDLRVQIQSILKHIGHFQGYLLVCYSIYFISIIPSVSIQNRQKIMFLNSSENSKSIFSYETSRSLKKWFKKSDTLQKMVGIAFEKFCRGTYPCIKNLCQRAKNHEDHPSSSSFQDGSCVGSLFAITVIFSENENDSSPLIRSRLISGTVGNF